MVTRVRITTTVEDDGSVLLPESQIQAAGIQAGDRVRVEIVKDARVTGEMAPGEAVEADPPNVLTAAELAALPFDEWLDRFRKHFPIPQDVEVEELIRQAEEVAADEWWARFNEHG